MCKTQCVCSAIQRLAALVCNSSVPLIYSGVTAVAYVVIVPFQVHGKNKQAGERSLGQKKEGG